MVLQGLPRGAQVLLGQVQLKVLRVEDVDDSLATGMDSPVTVLEEIVVSGLVIDQDEQLRYPGYTFFMSSIYQIP